MLLTPRTYFLAQTPDEGSTRPELSYFLCGTQSRKKAGRRKEARARDAAAAPDGQRQGGRGGPVCRVGGLRVPRKSPEAVRTQR
jgi:hypothetical protein